MRLNLSLTYLAKEYWIRVWLSKTDFASNEGFIAFEGTKLWNKFWILFLIPKLSPPWLIHFIDNTWSVFFLCFAHLARNASFFSLRKRDLFSPSPHFTYGLLSFFSACQKAYAEQALTFFRQIACFQVSFYTHELAIPAWKFEQISSLNFSQEYLQRAFKKKKQ